MDLIGNIKRAVSNPALGFEFLVYSGKKIIQKEVTYTYPNGVTVGGHSGFSEYHSHRSVIDHAESDFLSKLPGYLEQNGVTSPLLIDIGANMGVFSLFLNRYFSACTIHCFEPSPNTFQTLRANLDRNQAKSITPHNLAVSDSNTPLLFDSRPDARANAKFVEKSNANAETVIEVPCVTMDEFAAESLESRQINFLKVDVEGFESMVFRGAKNLLSEHKIDLIYFEVVPTLTKQAGFGESEPMELLAQAGYSLYRFTPEDTIQSVTDFGMSGIVFENWLAVSPENRESFEKYFYSKS